MERPVTPDEDILAARERKRAAKVHNERVKLTANPLNALAVAITIAAVIVPGVASPSSLLGLQGVTWFRLLSAYIFSRGPSLA